MQQYHVMQVICTTCKNMFIVYAHMAGFPDAIIAEKNFKKYLYTKTNLINLLPINYIFFPYYLNITVGAKIIARVA